MICRANIYQPRLLQEEAGITAPLQQCGTLFFVENTMDAAFNISVFCAHEYSGTITEYVVVPDCLSFIDDTDCFAVLQVGRDASGVVLYSRGAAAAYEPSDHRRPWGQRKGAPANPAREDVGRRRVLDAGHVWTSAFRRAGRLWGRQQDDQVVVRGSSPCWRRA